MKKEPTEAEVMLMEDYGITLDEARRGFVPEAMERFARKKTKQMQLLINIMQKDEHDGIYTCSKCDDKKLLEVSNLDGDITIRKCPFCIESKTTIEIDKSTFGTLQMIRNYFDENDRTPFEHLAFDVIDRIIKSNTP